MSWDRLVFVVTGCRLDDLDLIPSRGRDFSLTIMSISPTECTHPLNQLVPGAIALGVKWPEHGHDPSPPYSAEVKNVWSYTSTCPYIVSWYLSTGTGLGAS
jgi:hypothetical protein